MSTLETGSAPVAAPAAHTANGPLHPAPPASRRENAGVDFGRLILSCFSWVGRRRVLHL